MASSQLAPNQSLPDQLSTSEELLATTVEALPHQPIQDVHRSPSPALVERQVGETSRIQYHLGEDETGVHMSPVKLAERPSSRRQKSHSRSRSRSESDSSRSSSRSRSSSKSPKVPLEKEKLKKKKKIEVILGGVNYIMKKYHQLKELACR